MAEELVVSKAQKEILATIMEDDSVAFYSCPPLRVLPDGFSTSAEVLAFILAPVGYDKVSITVGAQHD